MTNNNFSQIAAFIWSVADLLRGDFKQSQYGRVILPFTLLRRLECVFEPSKAKVLEANEKVKAMPLPEEAKEKMLLKATEGLTFFNTSELDLTKLGKNDIRANLNSYIQHFSKDAREIFEHFKFEEFIGLLDDANLLYKVVQYFTKPEIDLSPQKISNHDMGLAFEELIRRFAESSNETAGEHFTPRDIVRLTTGLIFSQDDDALNKEGVIRTIYDPTAGTGGFLSSGTEYVYEHNPEAVMRVFGQELNPESYAICKADMLIKGQDVSRIKLGNTLSNDQLAYEKFDYMLSNPPFGVDWKKIEQEIKDEHEQKGFNGRFGAGLPRVSDGSLLFLMHLISKMRDVDSTGQGSRIGIILNGSPLFTGSAGSGESEIRRYILEADLLEAIIALPTDMFYNTGIATYVWVLSNKKDIERKGKVHLINAASLSSKMRKSLGSKRNYLTDAEIKTITQNYGAFEAVDTLTLDGESEQQKPFSSKIFNSYEFGYRRVTIERPLRLSAQLSDERIASLRFAPKPFNTVMQKIYDSYGKEWTEASYGQLSDDQHVEIRALIKAEFSELKEKDIKTVLEPKLWLEQRALIRKAEALQAKIGTAQHDDFNAFDELLKQTLKDTSIKLEAKEKKQFLDAVTWKNHEAEPVMNKVVKAKENPLYGQFSYQGKVVEFVQDGDLRDAENIALDPSQNTTNLIESYFKREVQPHVPDAWINADKRDAQDGEIGIVGYEIPFNRHFYVYEPPRDLAEIDADLDAVSREIMALLQEVHS
ncbi:type I restriction-modification system subunit M [Acinetobacter haemolyticus]|uniref:type I restriction-modification system subunit M n=2 Tax=Acinetobacter TaxID=469 RepID=UPI000DE8FA77|nr:class I SAM-dependent DNA methyltransferase [Acinetobacter haemolyticus]WHR57431.1 class I SAM-dependent DNA methyltransferase [Acinetobacter haemolyticus]